MKTPAKINASRDESGKMLIGLDGTGAGLLLLAGRIASGVLATVASNEKELAELKNVMHKMIDEACKEEWLDKISGKRGVQTDNMTEFFRTSAHGEVLRKAVRQWQEKKPSPSLRNTRPAACLTWQNFSTLTRQT